MRMARSVAVLIAGSVAGLLVAAYAADPQKEQANAPAPARPTPFAHGTGVTAQIKAMDWLAGTWTVTMTYFGPNGASFKKETESIIEPMLGGAFYQERITVPAGPNLDNHMIGIRSFDRFRGVFRIVWFDDIITLADVFEGETTPNGFIATNLRTRTAGMFNGRESVMRITQKAGPTKDEFVLTWEVTPDEGKTWATSAEYRYVRKK